MLHRIGVRKIGFVDHEHVGDLMIPPSGLHAIADSGTSTTTVIKPGRDLDFVLPHTHGFDNHVIAAGGVQAGEVGGGARQAAEGAARGHGAIKMPRRRGAAARGAVA